MSAEGAPQQTVKYLTVLLTGSIQPVTTDKTIWSGKFTFQLDPLAGGSAFIGTRQGTSTAPTTLDVTNCIAQLMPGSIYTPDLTSWLERGGAQFQLEQFYINGPGGAYLHISWPDHAVGVF